MSKSSFVAILILTLTVLCILFVYPGMLYKINFSDLISKTSNTNTSTTTVSTSTKITQPNTCTYSNTPDLPTNLVISPSDTTLTVSWTLSSNASYYNVYLKSGIIATPNSIATSQATYNVSSSGMALLEQRVTMLPVVITNLNPDTNYVVGITSVNCFGETSTMITENISTYCSAITNFVLTYNSSPVTSVSISWTASQGALAYQIGYGESILQTTYFRNFKNGNTSTSNYFTPGMYRSKSYLKAYATGTTSNLSTGDSLAGYLVKLIIAPTDASYNVLGVSSYFYSAIPTGLSNNLIAPVMNSPYVTGANVVFGWQAQNAATLGYVVFLSYGPCTPFLDGTNWVCANPTVMSTGSGTQTGNIYNFPISSLVTSVSSVACCVVAVQSNSNQTPYYSTCSQIAIINLSDQSTNVLYQ